MKNGKFLKKFNLEQSVACGPLRIDFMGKVDLQNIQLQDIQKDYLVHITYSTKEKNYRFEAYRKKE
jgi:hypothetical protein